MSILAVIFGILSGCFARRAGGHHRQPPPYRLRLGVSDKPDLHAARRADRRPADRSAARRRAAMGLCRNRRRHSGAVVLRRVPAAGADGRGHAAGPVKTGTEILRYPLHQAARRFDSGIFLKEGSSTEVEEPVGYAPPGRLRRLSTPRRRDLYTAGRTDRGAFDRSADT